MRAGRLLPALLLPVLLAPAALADPAHAPLRPAWARGL